MADLPTVLIVGPGDVGRRFADRLAGSGRIGEIVLAGLSRGGGAGDADMIASCHDCLVRFEAIDALDQSAVESLLRREKPDLVVQAASLRGPWEGAGRTDKVIQALAAAGLGVQLPAQIPVLATVMRAVREVGHDGPVANVSLPDVAHEVLDKLGLAPTIGLGNVSIMHLRVRAALRRRLGAGVDLPDIRLIGQHNQVYDVMQARPPAPEDAWRRLRVWIADVEETESDIAYEGEAVPPGWIYNEITAASALPVMLSLLPDSEALRFSAPAPRGLPGGYPVRIEGGQVALDLPDGVTLTEAVAGNRRLGERDGIAAVADDGTVTFTEAARAALREVDPALTEPLAPSGWLDRYDRLRTALAR